MSFHLSPTDLQKICDRYERLPEDSPPIARRPTAEEYTNARATLDRLQKEESQSKQILQIVNRIDQHLDVVEEKIDAAPARPPSPDTQIALQLETQKREMEAMKAVMESMRLEKERQERELVAARHRAEQDAKLRAEQEEARELSEIHKRLHEINVRSYSASLDGRNKALLSSLSQREVVLFQDHHERYLTYIITNKNIYRVLRQGYHTGPVLCAIYTFNTMLTKKQILLLEMGIATNTESGHGRLIGRLSDCHYNRNAVGDAYTTAPPKFESVIRLIPGSYQNGDWRQLDGFFGMYYNETTMEVSEYPPPSL